MTFKHFNLLPMLLVVVALGVAGCPLDPDAAEEFDPNLDGTITDPSGSNGDVDDGDSNQAVPEPTVMPIFVDADVGVADDARLAWAPDDSLLAFPGRVRGSLFTVPVAADSVPTAVSEIRAGTPILAGRFPTFLNDSNVAFVSPTTTTALSDTVGLTTVPAAGTATAPSTLARFDPATSSLTTRDFLTTQSTLSFSADGLRGVGTFGPAGDVRTFTRFPGSQRFVTSQLTGVPAAADAVISPDGELIAFETFNGDIVVRPFLGGQDVVVGQGTFPSFDGSGTLIAFVEENDDVLQLRDLTTETVEAFPLPAGVERPVLSRDAMRIAFPLQDGVQSGIGVIELDREPTVFP